MDCTLCVVDSIESEYNLCSYLFVNFCFAKHKKSSRKSLTKQKKWIFHFTRVLSILTTVRYLVDSKEQNIWMDFTFRYSLLFFRSLFCYGFRFEHTYCFFICSKHSVWVLCSARKFHETILALFTIEMAEKYEKLMEKRTKQNRNQH